MTESWTARLLRSSYGVTLRKTWRDMRSNKKPKSTFTSPFTSHHTSYLAYSKHLLSFTFIVISSELSIIHNTFWIQHFSVHMTRLSSLRHWSWVSTGSCSTTPRTRSWSTFARNGHPRPKYSPVFISPVRSSWCHRVFRWRISPTLACILRFSAGEREDLPARARIKIKESSQTIYDSFWIENQTLIFEFYNLILKRKQKRINDN